MASILTSGDAKLAYLYRVARVLLEEREYGDLLAALLDVTIEVAGAERGMLLVPDGDRFHVAVARNFRSETLQRKEEEISASIAGDALRTGHTILLGDAGSSQFAGRQSVQYLSLKSVLCAPVIAAQRPYALIYLENRNVTHCFDETHRELLNEVCALAAPRLQVAVAVEDARKRASELETGLRESDGIVTADPRLAALLETARQVARTDLPVLIHGETGTGKELLARLIYRHSSRAHAPMVPLNCAAIPANLIESELFGHVRGAFSGAVADKIGFVAAAHRGTLFLDEIGDLPAELQPKLLRVLQSGEYNRVGSVRPEIADVRIIAATNRDLESDMDEGRFRSDLFYRLNTVRLRIPPLRERPHDIHLLCEHFLKVYSTRFGKARPTLSSEAFAVLSRYRFPGNVRELESEMARLAAIMPAGATIPADALGESILKKPRPDHRPLPPMTIDEMEKQLITSVLEHTAGNRTRAAEVLGITREGLRTKMQRLGLSVKSE